MNAATWLARLECSWDIDAWRQLARHAWCAGLSPEELHWFEAEDSGQLFGTALEEAVLVRAMPPVPRAFLALASTVICHSSPTRLPLLYRLLWRQSAGERNLLANPTDPDVIAVHAMAKEVQRDTHKMKAFVRFREVATGSNEFIAWFEPDHHILDRVAPFFAGRFAGMDWAIMTPYRSVRWNQQTLKFGDGTRGIKMPDKDSGEGLWLIYYAHIFNPARLNPEMMRQEMPSRYWRNLPEAALLPDLTRNAGARVREMAERAPLPVRRKIPTPKAPTQVLTADAFGSLPVQVAACRKCPLWASATQVVPGRGAEDAPLMFLGEQPGDQEDLTGRPFVGPAGKLLKNALQTCGLPESAIYFTNAVKHFRYERVGKARIHKRPDHAHVQACRPWLQREVDTLKPRVVVCLGATATLSLLGSGFAFKEVRGQWLEAGNGLLAFVTVHPAWVLRQTTQSDRERAFNLLVQDLGKVQEEMGRWNA